MSQLILSRSDLLAFITSYFLLAATPGPNFALVSNAAMTASRKHALSAAFGIAVGATLIAILIVSGRSVIVYDEQVRQSAKFAFAAYLFYLAFRSWKRARAQGRQPAGNACPSRSGYFRMALLTAVANPTTAMLFASSPIQKGDSLATVILVALPVFVIASLWFGMVATVASIGAGGKVPQLVFNRIDAGFVLVFVVLAMLTLIS